MKLSRADVLCRSALAATLAAACSSHPAPVVSPGGELEGPPPAALAIDGGAGALGGPASRRLPLGDATDAALPFTIEPIAGGRGVLLVAQDADARGAFVRRVDANGESGPPIAVVDEHVLGAFDGLDGRLTLATSDGLHLCVATYARGATAPEGRGCEAVSPSAVVQVGDDLALLSVDIERSISVGPKAPTKPAPRSVKPKPPPPKEPRKAHQGPDNDDDGGRRGPRLSGTGTSTLPLPVPAPAGRVAPRHRPLAHVMLRRVSPLGVFEPGTVATGLVFEEPLEGMALVDARARSGGIDVLWFENATGRRNTSHLGAARLMAGALRADGSFDAKRRSAVVDGALDYGALRDHHRPRLFGNVDGSAYVGLDARGHCESVRILPSRARITPEAAVCAVDPDSLALGPPSAHNPLLEALLANGPRRTLGQPPDDPGLVAWAGDRAYFLAGGKLRSAARTGETRDEPAPFAGKRSRIAWGAIASDGESVAVVGGSVVHLDPLGKLVTLAASLEAPLPLSTRTAELPPERLRAARIGGTWWSARGDLVRLWPDFAAPVTLRGAAPPDTSALVGGASRGLLLSLAGEALRVRGIDGAGHLVPLGPGTKPFVSPVRVGFDACERAGGGAIIAGVSARDASKVVAFAMDHDGHVGAENATPLLVGNASVTSARPDAPPVSDLGVRLVPLPMGGALLTDLKRRHVVWLDDDARPLADLPWPGDESLAACVDGHPTRAFVPTPTPGKLVRLDALATPGTCIVGEARWTADGSLRWLGSAVSGLDAQAEAGVVAPWLDELRVPPRPKPVVDVAPLEARAPACPPEMVSVTGRFCIDRFEGTIVDKATDKLISPDYPASPNLLEFALGEWATQRERLGNVHARALPLPLLDASRLGQKLEPVAVSRMGVRPSGYLTGVVAEAACSNAGKRLCSADEFLTACRGEGDTPFPYGATYVDGACNVFREDHPAALLHDNASLGHLDPRLNHVTSNGRPLFQRTGESPACKSRWGNDAVYDLVGNVDEWIDDPTGAFAGGFYARATRSGCDARIASHPKAYLDYSTGLRCCREAVVTRAASPDL